MHRWMVKPIRQTPRRLLRGHARSHRALRIAKAWLILQCNHRWQNQLLQVSQKPSANGDTPVGAGVPANTGEAGARLRVARLAGTPAPTGHCLLPKPG